MEKNVEGLTQFLLTLFYLKLQSTYKTNETTPEQRDNINKIIFAENSK